MTDAKGVAKLLPSAPSLGAKGGLGQVYKNVGCFLVPCLPR